VRHTAKVRGAAQNAVGMAWRQDKIGGAQAVGDGGKPTLCAWAAQ
jgi:hypothetical protein